MTQRSEICLELRLKEAEGCFGWRLLSATYRSWKKMDIEKRKTRESTTMKEGGNMARSGMHPQEGIRLLILRSGAGAFEVYLWAGRTFSIELELSGDEGLVGGSEPAGEVDEDDSITTRNAVVRGLE